MRQLCLTMTFLWPSVACVGIGLFIVSGCCAENSESATGTSTSLSSSPNLLLLNISSACSYKDGDIFCDGRGTNTEVLKTALNNIKNEVQQHPRNETGRTGEVNKFFLASTSVQILDLHLLSTFHSVGNLFLSYNRQLRSIISKPEEDKILFKNIIMVWIDVSPLLGDSGLNETLKLFSSSQNLTLLSLAGNSLVGNDTDSDSDLLPGLSSLHSLEHIDLSNNKITTILYRQFQNFPNLTYLSLANNRISQVEASFLFLQSKSRKTFKIYLSFNLLQEDSFFQDDHGKNNSSDSTTRRRKNSSTLLLTGNNLKSIPSSIFLPFLQSNPNNTLNLQGNPLICDARTEWLKNGDFENQVGGAECVNQQRNPLFGNVKKTVASFTTPETSVILECPRANEIIPCKCHSFSSTISNITCIGPLISQGNIDNLFQLVRRVNGLNDNNVFQIGQLVIHDTAMTGLNLFPLYKTHINAVQISGNSELTKIYGTPLIPDSIVTKVLRIENNTKLDDEGLCDVLKLFKNSLQTLFLSKNALRGHFNRENEVSGKVSKMEREFLPGLAKQSNLTILNLNDNRIEELGVGRFRNHSKLVILSLQRNFVSRLEENVAFHYFSPDNNFLVDLSENKLGQDLFSPGEFFDFGPIRSGASWKLTLDKNVPFEYYLSADARRRHLLASAPAQLFSAFEKNSTRLVCPDEELIRPCTCDQEISEVICQGHSVTQYSIDATLGNLNVNTSQNPQVFMKHFAIFNTTLEELDLSSLDSCQIYFLSIEKNRNLRKINNARRLHKIHSARVRIQFNGELKDKGLRNIISYFSSEFLEYLNLEGNSIALFELPRGFFAFPKLKNLILRDNKISRLTSGLFDGLNPDLENLDLSENQIEEIDQQVFGFLNQGHKTMPVVINLNFNQLTENSFPMEQTGLENGERPIELNLINNKMATLPFRPFKKLLDPRKGLKIDLYGNPLICDWRLSWLKQPKFSKDNFVKNAECANQLRATVQTFKQPKTVEFCSSIVMFEVSPCACNSSSDSFECIGPLVDKEEMQKLFVRFKRFDPWCSGTLPNPNIVLIQSTNLTQLNMTDFFLVCLTNLTTLTLDSNPRLREIKGPQLGSIPNEKLISVQKLKIRSSPLSDHGFGSTLDYFSPEMTMLDLTGNQLTGQSTVEFLPGLSKLTKLVRIVLNKNEISRLAGGPFKNNSNLGQISLVENKISRIGPTTFLFSYDQNDQNKTLEIDLTSNSIKSDSFEERNLLDKIHRPVNLILKGNLLNSLPAEPFENFLNRSNNNTIDLEGNPEFIFDDNLLWLKRKKREFQNQIFGAETIFNSDFFYLNESRDWIYITISAVVGLSALILILIGIRKYSTLKIRLRNLTEEEIREFFEGNPKAANQENPKVEDLPFTKIIDPDNLVIQKNCVLGRGQFGIVYRGILEDQPVAVKTVPKEADTTFFKEFLRELKLMQYLGHHPHVISFLGAQVSEIRDRIVYAVVELATQNLKGHFKNNKLPPFPDLAFRTRIKQKFVGWAIQIARGMEFLEYNKIIHADLAARNVLMFPENILKITDFGLARKLYKQHTKYKHKPERYLPVASLAIESLTRLEFTHKSDVWTFSVLLWEIFTYGKDPPFLFHGNPEKSKQLKERRQNILEMPTFADFTIYQKMTRCWDYEPDNRPSFKELGDFFEEYSRTLETAVGNVNVNSNNDHENLPGESSIVEIQVGSEEVSFTQWATPSLKKHQRDYVTLPGVS